LDPNALANALVTAIDQNNSAPSPLEDGEEEYLDYSDDEEHDDEGDSDIESVAAAEDADESAAGMRLQLSDRMESSNAAPTSTPQKPPAKSSVGSEAPKATSDSNHSSRPASVIREPRLFKQIEHMIASIQDGTSHDSATGDSANAQELREVKRLSQVFRSPDILMEMIQPDIDSKQAVYGPGASSKHPWTSRVDHGINSRTEDGYRGKQIYFVGIIDILQQYNTFKRAETFFKVLIYACIRLYSLFNFRAIVLHVQGFTNDRKQISSVPANEYAQRFVEFLDKNID
jgi:hypothetical protein